MASRGTRWQRGTERLALDRGRAARTLASTVRSLPKQPRRACALGAVAGIGGALWLDPELEPDPVLGGSGQDNTR
jgi:hypothetical protein